MGHGRAYTMASEVASDPSGRSRPKGLWGLLGCLAVLSFLALPGNGVAQEAPGPSAEDLYITFLGCAGCHGMSGEGGVGPELRDTELSLEEFIKFIREPMGAMPPFGENLAPDSELETIYDWLREET